MSDFIKIHPADNVAVAIHDTDTGIPAGHKVALKDMIEGDLALIHAEGMRAAVKTII